MTASMQIVSINGFEYADGIEFPSLIEDSKKVNIVRDNSVSSGIIKTNDSPFTKGMLARFFTHKPTHCEGLWTQIAMSPTTLSYSVTAFAATPAVLSIGTLAMLMPYADSM